MAGFLGVEFEGFTGRNDELEKIIRFNMESRFPMFYRTNDLLHSRRVGVMCKDIETHVVSAFGDKYDPKKALTLALVQYDAEIINGDVKLNHTERMSLDELTEKDKEEERAIEILSNRWPKRINGFSYEELLYHALRKDCIEAQVVSYCDKLDGFCESLHEVLAGSTRFEEPANTYVERIREFPYKYHDMGKLLFGGHPLLEYPENLDTNTMIGYGRFHDSASILMKTGISHYDRWKKLSVDYFGMGVLVDVKENFL